MCVLYPRYRVPPYPPQELWVFAEAGASLSSKPECSAPQSPPSRAQARSPDPCLPLPRPQAPSLIHLQPCLCKVGHRTFLP